MTANHVEHEIATFPRITGGVSAPAVKREAEEDWSKKRWPSVLRTWMTRKSC